MGIVGSSLSAVGSIFGGISASNAMKRAKQRVNDQLKENRDWYDRRYNEDATQRADAQRAITMAEESIRNRNRQAAGTQAIMGGTDESLAAAKEANNKAIADTTSAIAANGDQRKDAIESQYFSSKAALMNQLNTFDEMQADEITKAVKGVGEAGNAISF